MDPAATVSTAQDVTSRIEQAIYSEPESVEPEEKIEEVVSEDDLTDLPEDDDTDSIDDEGSEDLEAIAQEEDLSLADYLGVDEDKIKVSEDGTVSYLATVDGEAQEVSLKELAKSFQLQGHVNNKSIAIENDRKQFEEQRNVALGELKTRVEGLDALGKVLEQQLVQEYDSIDWDRLRAENPSEWSAMRQEFSERAQKVQQSQQLIIEEGQRAVTEEQGKIQTLHANHMQQEFQKMVEGNPTWTDEKVRDADLLDMRNFVSEAYGFTDQDLQAVTDHRLVKLIQDAKAFRQGSKSAESKKQKIVPKFQKPGASKDRSAQTAKARGVKAKRDAVRKTGHINDVASLIEDRM